MNQQELKRRNISGIYIFDTFPNEEHREPTCVEDCQQSTRRAWCMTKTPEYLCETIKMLNQSFTELCEFLHEDEYLNDEQFGILCEISRNSIERTKPTYDIQWLCEEVDFISGKITLLADCSGTVKGDKEDGQDNN